ncbi:MAG: glycosyltransferase family 2 protein [Actinomycetia bacterium]|nr:glycosyltransferase family 2 protein [Actinomycetes bacterium]
MGSREPDLKYDRGKEIKELSIIIVSYNSLGYLRECLDSIYSHPPGKDFDIVVVDNASYDGTNGYIRKNHSDVILITNKKNKGFAAANNQAIKTTDSKYILLINSDCEVYEDSINKLTDYIDKNPRVAVAGPKIINSDGSVQYSCRRFPSFFGAAAHTVLTHIYPANPISRKYMMADVSRDEPFSVDWVSGSCMIIRRESLKETGPLDENYFMYVEDIDICYRIWQNGWEVYYMPHSEILHHIGGSSRRTSRRALVRASYRMQKSVFYFFWKNYRKSIKILLMPLLFMILGLRFLIAAVKSMVKR